MGEREARRLVQRGELRESLIYYSIVVMVLLALTMVVLSAIPLYQQGFEFVG